MVGKEREKYLTSFLIELGVKTSPRTYMENDDGYYHRTSEKFVDGLLEIIAAVEETKNEDLSAFLWEQMCVLADESILGYYVLNKTVRSRPDGRYNFRTEYVASATKEALIEKLWLVNNEGVFVSAEELTKRDLSSIYDLDLDGAASLLSLLDISDVVEVEDEDDSNLTDEQREKIALANKLKAYGIDDDDDLEEFLEYKRQKEAQMRAAEQSQEERRSSDESAHTAGSRDIDDIFDEDDAENVDCSSKTPRDKKKISKATTDVIKDIARRTKEKPSVIPSYTLEEDDADEDEYIDKLLASEKLPKEVDVQVGTIHGFQGDECDIIFAVFNTPPTISASKDMFLNKRNIINVSISRARDYLFVVMPDDDTDNISNLRLVKRVESLIQSTDAWNEFLTPDLEELMFGDAKYLENNAFSTSHQSVNVYGLPEKIYEVRTEDTAVDVQIHRSTSKKEEVDPTLASGTVVVDEPQYMDSYDLDESLIPEELRDTAIDLPVRGAINGWCYLVPYEGKLKSHTVKKVIGMFIPQNRNGQEKMVSVSVVKEDRIIYISKDMFKIYEQSLSEPDGIQLKRTFF